ncbi:ABC transporter ATP-binding protein [Arcanobacterium canis]
MGDVCEIANVSVVRGGTEILKNINWDLDEGQRWVVLGPNGAGKTTLIQLLSGRVFPTSGNVSVIGEDLCEVPLDDIRPLIGLSSEALDTTIPGFEKVHDVVRTAAWGKTVKWREHYEDEDNKRAAMLLDFFGVGYLAERQFRTLSSGERKRVGMARALMPNPEVLILDEPAAGLDLAGRERLMANLTALADEGNAPVIVLVTHHVEEIPAGFTHALLLKDGEILAAGPMSSTLTETNLSTLFSLPITLTRKEGRFSATAR